MSQFANDKYYNFQKIWTQYDEFSFKVGIALGFWLLAFQLMTGFGISKVEKESNALVGFALSLTFYILAQMGFVPLGIAALITVVVSFG